MNKLITHSLRLIFVLVVILLPVASFAYDFKVGGIYYNKASGTDVAVTYYSGSSSSNKNAYIGDIVIPEKVTYNGTEYSVTSIDVYAFFGCTGLTSVTIPNSVITIGGAAFYSCTGLTSVIIPNSVTTIGGSAFNGCTGLTSVTIPNSVTWIGESAFSSCYELTSLVFNATKCTACGSLFYPAFPSSITSLTIGNNVTVIPSYFNVSKIENLTIPESVISIGESAFSSCYELTSLVFNATKCTACGTSSYPAFPSLISSLTIGSNVTVIPDYFLYKGSRIETLTIPNSVTSIGYGAFLGSNKLKSLTIGAGLLTIGSYAFSTRTSSSYQYTIAKVFWMGNTPPSGYNNVKASVNYVANDLYSFNNQLKYQFLSSKFSMDGTIYIPVSPSDRTCDVVDCEYSSQYTDVTIGEKVSNRGVEMSVLNLNKYAFYDNDYVKSLNISNKGSVGDYSFYGCSALTEFTIPDSVTELGESAFQNCSSIENISIGTGVPSLPTSVFSGCSSLKSITVPNNITSVGNYAFYGCSSLGDITIEDAEQDKDTDRLTLGSNGSSPLFSDCPLDEVYIGRKLSYNTNSNYGYSPFYRNTSLRTVEITDAETQIYDNEFYGCSNLKSLKIGNGVKTIGNWAFSGCSSLDYFSAGYLVESIGKEAFSDCTGLTKYYSYSIVPPRCGDQAMDDINKWECTLYVPDESSDEYKAAPQWKEFFFIEEMDAVLVAEIRLDVTDLTLMPNETLQLHAEILPNNATDKSMTWSSSDVGVANVSENGLITAIADGTATITVKSHDGNTEATCVVTVDSHNSGIVPVINDKDESLEVFNLNGYKLADSIENLAQGIYIVKKGERTYKIVIR